MSTPATTRCRPGIFRMCLPHTRPQRNGKAEGAMAQVAVVVVVVLILLAGGAAGGLPPHRVQGRYTRQVYSSPYQSARLYPGPDAIPALSLDAMRNGVRASAVRSSSWSFLTQLLPRGGGGAYCCYIDTQTSCELWTSCYAHVCCVRWGCAR